MKPETAKAKRWLSYILEPNLRLPNGELRIHPAGRWVHLIYQRKLSLSFFTSFPRFKSFSTTFITSGRSPSKNLPTSSIPNFQLSKFPTATQRGMSEGDTDDFSNAARISIITTFHNLSVCHYMTISAFAIWFWDVLITTDEEVNYVWKNQGFLIKIL